MLPFGEYTAINKDLPLALATATPSILVFIHTIWVKCSEIKKKRGGTFFLFIFNITIIYDVNSFEYNRSWK